MSGEQISNAYNRVEYKPGCHSCQKLSSCKDCNSKLVATRLTFHPGVHTPADCPSTEFKTLDKRIYDLLYQCDRLRERATIPIKSAVDAHTFIRDINCDLEIIAICAKKIEEEARRQTQPSSLIHGPQ